MTTWTDLYTKVSFPTMYRGAMPYSMDVFGPYADGDFDVEVYIDGDMEPRGTFTISRNTHVVADMWDNVEACIADYCKEQGI